MTAQPLSRRPPSTLLDALKARLHGRALDRELASGVTSWRSRRHANRSLQLTSRRRRDGLAATLQSTLSDAGSGRLALYTCVIAPCRPSVIGCAGQLSELAARLRDPEPVNAEGMARLELLLSDGIGPLYTPNRLGDLQRALHQIKHCLAVPG